jgi:hypothetical protein
MFSVYWYIFSEYRGSSITEQYKAKYPYQGVLYKVGHQKGEEEFGRVLANAKYDKDVNPIWIDLWGNIQCGGIIKGFNSKEEAKAVEEKILQAIGPKDFNLYEKISGIREFRIASLERKEILNKYFN